MARSMGRRIGLRSEVNPKYAYADPAEIANRDKTAFQPRPTEFEQIPPGDHGGNLNEPNVHVRSGMFKFNPPVK